MSNKLNDDESQSRNGYEMGGRGDEWMSGAHDTVVRRVQTPILSAAFPLARDERDKNERNAPNLSTLGLRSLTVLGSLSPSLSLSLSIFARLPRM